MMNTNIVITVNSNQIKCLKCHGDMCVSFYDGMILIQPCESCMRTRYESGKKLSEDIKKINKIMNDKQNE